MKRIGRAILCLVLLVCAAAPCCSVTANSVLFDDAVSDNEKREGYCGFDLYTCEYGENAFSVDGTTGMGCAITNETAAVGKASLHIRTGNGIPEPLTSFELRNTAAFPVLDHTTYRIDFLYRADGEFTVGFGVGKADDAARQHVVLAQQTYGASQTFVGGFVILETDSTKTRSFDDAGLTFAATVTADETVNVYLDDLYVTPVVTTVGYSRLTQADAKGQQALRFYMAYQSLTPDSVSIAGTSYRVVKRGVLLKAFKNPAALTLEQSGKNGVVCAKRTDDFGACWSRNRVTDTRVYCACVAHFRGQDTRRLCARGFVQLEDGSVYYSNVLNACVTDASDEAASLDFSVLNCKEGTLRHTSETESSVTDDKTGECMKDAYFFLPVGTVVYGKSPYRAFLYDEFFVLDTSRMTASGETMEDEFNPCETTGELVLKKGSYVRFSTTGRLSDLHIDVPTEKEVYLCAGRRTEMMYDLEALRVRREVMETADGSVNYLFITDLHYDSSVAGENAASVIRQVNTMARMANEDDTIDFVAVGGDLTTGMYASREAALKDINRVLEPLRQCTKPVLVLTGNHDDNSYHAHWSGGQAYRPALILGNKEWNDNVLKTTVPAGIVHDSQQKDSKYYYYDLTEKKTRIVCLAAADYPYQTDWEGNLIALTVKNSAATGVNSCYAGASYWGYSARQLRWLIDEALQAPDGYQYIFLSHMGIDYDTNNYHGEIMYGAQLRGILKAYRNKTVFTDPEIGTADFSHATGQILIYQFGHIHAELVLYSEDVDLWQVCTATASVANYSTDLKVSSSINRKDYDWRYYKRAHQTIYEASLDAVTVGNDVIHKYAFGAGGDYVLYRKGGQSYETGTFH